MARDENQVLFFNQIEFISQREEKLKVEESYCAEFESYEGIGVNKGYGPCLAYNSDC